MKNIELEVGQAHLIDHFFAEVGSSPSQIRELLLVSPFVQLSGRRTRSGAALCRLIGEVAANGGSAMLISDDTPSRRKDFRRAIEAHHNLAGKLFVCKGLHAKCGLARNAVGNHVAFLGSANLTDAGLSKNTEIVLGLKGHLSEDPAWRLVGQLRGMIERIHSSSIKLQSN